MNFLNSMQMESAAAVWALRSSSCTGSSQIQHFFNLVSHPHEALNSAFKPALHERTRPSVSTSNESWELLPLVSYSAAVGAQYPLLQMVNFFSKFSVTISFISLVLFYMLYTIFNPVHCVTYHVSTGWQLLQSSQCPENKFSPELGASFLWQTLSSTWVR
jgi:hypothetical protein